MKKTILLIIFLFYNLCPLLAQQTLKEELTQAFNNYEKGKYEETLQLLRKNNSEIFVNYSDAKDLHISVLLLMGKSYEEIGEYEYAERIFDFRNEIKAKMKADSNKIVAKRGNIPSNIAPYYQKANDFMYQGKYPEAISEYKKVIQLYLDNRNEKDDVYASMLSNLAMLYRRMGQYEQAEPLYLEAIDIMKNISGEKDQSYITTVHNLGVLYKSMGYFAKAEPLVEEAVETRGEILGYLHPEYAASLLMLGNLNQSMGNYSRAEANYTNAKDIYKIMLGDKHPDYGNCLGHLASTYFEMGNYFQAEALYKEKIEICRMSLGENHPDYTSSLLNLADLYKSLDNYPQAEVLYKEAIKIDKSMLGDQHPYYASDLSSLAGLYQIMGNYGAAEPLYLEALKINKLVYGDQHTAYASNLEQLSRLYAAMADFARAEPLLQESIQIYKNNVGDQHPYYASLLNQLADLYFLKGDYTQVEPLLKKANDIYKAVLGDQNPSYVSSLISLAYFYHRTGDYPKAESFYQEVINNKTKQIETLLPTLSEVERKNYIKSIQSIFDNFYNFAVDYSTQKPAIVGDLYNLQLITKALIFQSIKKIQEQVFNHQDKSQVIFSDGKMYTLSDLFEKWKSKKAYLGKFLQMSTEEKNKQGISLDKEREMQEEVNQLEKDLSSKSNLMASMNEQKDKLYTWKDIQKELKPGEAAIEIIRIKKYNANNKIDTTYMAMILKPETLNYPEMVFLENGHDLENKYARFYINSIKKKLEDKLSYSKYWAKISEKLQGIKKVYFSADGVYNSISLGTLYNPDSDKYLADELDIQLLSNTKDLIKYNQNSGKLQQNLEDYHLYMMGYPSYSNTLDPIKNNLDTNRSISTLPIIQNISKDDTLSNIDRFFDRNSGKVSILEGTKIEIQNIQKIATGQGIKFTVMMQKEASEEGIKGLIDPSILHIATHGFFLADLPDSEGDKSKMMGIEKTKLIEDPLLRSGLLLAGAENTLKGEEYGDQDGILTSQEAMNLYLDNSDLVVLSACETGLGVVSNLIL